MKRNTIAALGLVAAATAGCMDMGLEGNIPLEEAQARETSELVAAVRRPTGAAPIRFIVDGRLWVPSGLPLTLAMSELRAVGSGDGQTVYARHWDQAPFDALFVRMTPPGESGALAAMPLEAERWIELRPVLGRTGPVPAHGGPAAAGGAADARGGH